MRFHGLNILTEGNLWKSALAESLRIAWKHMGLAREAVSRYSNELNDWLQRYRGRYINSEWLSARIRDVVSEMTPGLTGMDVRP